jgi:hypothetical protein
MCEKCIELDDKMERYRRIASRIYDQLTLDRIKELIAELESEKAQLHPEQQFLLPKLRSAAVWQSSLL